MLKFYKGKRVNIVRYFTLEGTHYSTFMDGAKEIVVKSSELHDEPSSNTVKLVDTINNSESTITIDASGIKMSVGDIKMVGSVTEVSSDQTLSSEEVDKVEEDTSTQEAEAETEEEVFLAKVVAVNNKTNKETILGERSGLSDSSEVKRLSLDPEAIIRVLDGVQKQHKGYKFKVVEA